MEIEIDKKNIFSNLIWKFMERVGTQGIQFIVQIILARLLLPEDYAIIALVSIFIVIANVFIQSGFNTALIQKKNADEIDFSSIFFLSMFVAMLIYIIIFFSAPFIADFFSESMLTSVLRVISITIFFGAVNSVQIAIISRRLQFKKLFIGSLIATVISGSVGIFLAYNDFSVWALVSQQLTYQFILMIVLTIMLKWHPQIVFSLNRVKSLFSFSWKLLVSSLIENIYMNIRLIFIGRLYNPTILGSFYNGQIMPQTITSNINGSIQSVMFPALSSQQDNKKNIKSMVRRSIVTSSFLVFPMMVGLAAVSDTFVRVILTEKWLPAVPFLQIFCFSYLFWPIHTANLQAINALGRSDIFLKLEILKKIVGILILGISLFFGVYAIALGMVISGVIGTFINAYPNKNILDYGYKEQIRDILPSLMLSGFMGLLVFSIQFLDIVIWVRLFMQIFFGITIYFSFAKIFKLECFEYLIKTVKELCNSKSKMAS